MLEEGRGGNAEYRTLQSCWLGDSQGKSETGSRIGEARGDPRKRKTTPDGSVADIISEGTYLGDLSWALQAE